MNKNKIIVKALKSARPFLSKIDRYSKGEQFICAAIDRAYQAGNIGPAATRLAKSMIMKRIGHRQICIEVWLKATVGEMSYYKAKLTNPNVVQEYRHRWLDSLIKEHS